MGALLDLFTSHGHAGVPIGLEHGLAKLLRAVGIGALADHQKRGVLVEGDLGVDRRRTGFGLDMASGRSEVCTRLHHRGQVRRSRAAASPDHRDAELADELAVEFGQLLGGQVIVHGAVDHGGKAGIGQARHRDRGVTSEVVQRFEHLGRSGRAVEADDVDIHGFESTQRGTDLGAGEHGAGELDGDLHLEGQTNAGGSHGPAGAVDGGLRLEEVEDGLDDDQVNAALDQCCGLLFIEAPKVGIPNLTEGRELRSRPDAPSDPPGSIRGGVVVCRGSGETSGGQVQLSHPVGLSIFGQYRCEGPERVGLDHVASDFEKRPVDPVHRIRTADDQELIAAFEIGTPEVICGQLG